MVLTLYVMIVEFFLTLLFLTLDEWKYKNDKGLHGSDKGLTLSVV